MKKQILLLFVFFIPVLLPAQALHQWKGNVMADGESVELKLTVFKNNHFVVLVPTGDAPFAVEGTWDSEDDSIFNLTLITETIMGEEEIPFRQGRIYIIDENTAVILAGGLGTELTRQDSSNKELDKSEE